MTICGFWFLKTGKPLSKKGNAQKNKSARLWTLLYYRMLKSLCSLCFRLKDVFLYRHSFFQINGLNAGELRAFYMLRTIIDK